ncbi:MAG: PspC domain-containing protein [Algoriphagus sp.]|nr:PspC domain-containing protein [Algoriphagus sp.]
MKKTLSINIGGIVFHIEEDGYEMLKKYLDGINAHFSEYPDSKEIISDIENRIAEIFLSYLKNNNQVINAENVERLVEKMGKLADFGAEEPQGKGKEESQEEDFYKYVTPPSNESLGYKKIMRMEHKKILGGVCAGIAHYFSIDPLWIRLIFILLLFSGGISIDLDFFDTEMNFSIGFFIFLAYLVLWVILPVSKEPIDDSSIKKLFRNPDDKVLGGVASGLSVYLGIEALYLRLAFILMTFLGGSGVVIYIILWIITPLASSITEKIKMKGGKITLDNIEFIVKETIKPVEMAPESKAKKIVMAPFRLLGQVIDSLRTSLGPLGKFILLVIRIFFGTWILILGLVLTAAPLLWSAVYLGITDANFQFGEETLPIHLLIELVPFSLVASVFGLIAIPGITILILGLSVLVNKILIGKKFGFTAMALWFLCIGFSGYFLTEILSKFKESEKIETTVPLTLSPGIMVIGTKEEEEEKMFNLVQLSLIGTADSVVSLTQERSSKGKTKEEALENIQSIAYSYEVKDSLITFEKGYDLGALKTFREQSIHMTLAIPYDTPFIMEPSLVEILQNTLYENGFEDSDVRPEAIWVFNAAGLTCLTCPEKKGERRDWDSFDSEKTRLDSLNKMKSDSLSKAKFEGKSATQD